MIVFRKGHIRASAKHTLSDYLVPFLQKDRRINSPAERIFEDSVLRVRRRKGHGWASRGGIKLHHAITFFNLSDEVSNSTAIDIGSSTGGFVDVLLHFGAKKVYAVDVGYGLLDYGLRTHPNVAVLERTDAKSISPSMIDEPDGVGVLTCDASFTSLKHVLPNGMSLVRSGGILICLVKPQFEADRTDVERGGIVSDVAIHRAVCDDLEHWLGSQSGWEWIGTTESPVLGLSSGNKEFLMYARRK